VITGNSIAPVGVEGNDMVVEYKVRTVTRYIVTRYEGGPNGASSTQKGEYENGEIAHEVAYALCKSEHEASGKEVGSMDFRYPERVSTTE
jgi:hypothetical protein